MAEKITSSVQESHFDEVHMLMHIDGELPHSEADRLMAHLLVCPDCQREYRDLQEANLAYSHFYAQFEESLPTPAHNWSGFEQRLHETMTAPVPKCRPWWSKFVDFAGQINGRSLVPWTLSGAAAVLVLVFFLLHPTLRPLPTVNDVLSRSEHESASMDASISPVVYQKVSITDSEAPQAPVTVQIWNDQKHGRFREEAENWSQTEQKSAGKDRQAEPPRLLRDVNEAYAANHLRWTEPVSAEVFRAWVQSPGRKVQSINKEQLPGGAETYRLSAKVADTGSTPAPNTAFIRTMELLVRASDWHAVSERLTIANQTGIHTYEIAELEYQVIPLRQLPGSVFGIQEGSAAPVSDSGSASVPGEGQVPFADLAVDVLDRLDRVDALVQDQITVTRAGTEGLQISGIVRSESRKIAILAALGPLVANSAVKLNLLSAENARALGTTPLTHPTQMQSVEVLLNESGSIPEVRTYLAASRHVPERELDQAAEHYIAEAVTHSTEAQLHAQALKHIADIAPWSDSEIVTSKTNEKWHALVARHAQASQREIHQLEQQLSPIFAHGFSAGGIFASGISGTGDLRPTANRLLNLTTDSDRIVWQALSSNASPADRRGLTNIQFWRMLKEEDSLASQLAEKAHP
jgi:anti-sigma factor RsiW